VLRKLDKEERGEVFVVELSAGVVKRKPRPGWGKEEAAVVGQAEERERGKKAWAEGRSSRRRTAVTGRTRRQCRCGGGMAVGVWVWLV